MRTLAQLALLTAALGLTSCRVGNDLNGTCTRGESCVCDLIGNCSRSCDGAGCSFECRGTSNCTFTCEGGGCHTLCANTGNCITECPGGGCTLECKNVGTCIVLGNEDLAVKVKDLSLPPADLSSHD